MTGTTRTAAARPTGRGRSPWTGRPARQDLVRQHNLSLVLAHILEPRTPVTRAQIATATSLTRATVSDLVETLIAAHLVKELAPRASEGAGRPGVPLTAAERTVVGVGVEVAVDHLGVTVVDLTGLAVSQRIVEGDFRGSDATATLGRLGGHVRAVVDEVVASGMRPAGLCLAMPGLIDHTTGLLRYAPNLGWRDVPVLEQLRAATGLDLPAWSCGNDADLAAGAEAQARARRRGGSRTEENFVYVSGFVGIGGAVVRGGHVSTGVNGWGGEIGHTPIDPAGPSCSCGATGCLEQYAGRHALLARAGLPPLAPVTDLLDALDAGGEESPAARLAIADAASALGRAAATIVNIVDIDTVVLGGLYGQLFEELAEGVRVELERRVLAARWAPLTLDKALVSDYAVLHGAALTVLESVTTSPGAWAGAEDLASVINS